ncbi:MAG: ThiF family adenylyltransferase [Jatrophihabitans sp.]|uniref:ThiF family adenylyltransferase n=1 Tax=Jatrophihabitans sp. TaxID=1932789 RepID=UPI003F800394
MTTDYSRPLRLAGVSANTDPAAVRDAVENAAVLVSIDRTTPQAELTSEVLLANLRRLPLKLYLDATSAFAPPQDAIERIVRRLQEIDPDRPLQAGPAPKRALHIAVGTAFPTADISAVADGHGVRLRRRGHAFPESTAPATGLGAILAAAVLTAEAFKTIVPITPNRRRLLDRVDFCPVTLTEPEAAAVPVPVLHRTALVGAGAIGTAIGLILRALGARGGMTVVDPETFDEPNVSTYSLGGRADAAQRIDKVNLLERELPQLEIRPLKGTARDLILAIDNGDEEMPDIVFGAVDSVDARHEIASLHADLTLDGSTGGATGTSVGLAEATADGPCLRCYYPNLSTTASVERKLADHTGLPIARVAAGDLLTEEDIAPLSADQQDLLAPYLRTPICGLARSLGLTGSESEYDPSAAFVAQQAAALVVGAWLRRTNGAQGELRDVEYDALFGPVDGMIHSRRPQPGCRCQHDAHLISRVRAERQR